MESPRWFEGFWFVTVLVVVEICSILAYTSMQRNYCVFKSVGRLQGELDQTSSSTRFYHTPGIETNCWTCYHSVLFTKATLALMLDMVVTVSHMALPVSWIVMLPPDT